MQKWVISAFLYVGAVIGICYFYENWVMDEKPVMSEHAGLEGEMETKEVSASHGTEESHSDEGSNNHSQEENAHAHGEASTHEGVNEVNIYIQNDRKNINIYLKDKLGNPVNGLEVNHEKILHLIMVDDTMQKYYHVHPEKVADGEFSIINTLPEGFYKAFVDIKPTHLGYHVTPVPFIVGNPSISHHNGGLQPDTSFTRTIDDQTVTLTMSTTKANEPATLSFDLDKTNLTPYLGAMGHVVILDDGSQEFLHVHPQNEKEPIFKTEFKKPGIYKVWAEFQQNGKVRAFPFVIKIE